MTDRSSLLSLVRSLSLFQGLDPDSQAAVAELLEWFSFPGGVTLFEAGDAADALYIVMHGCLGAFARMPSGERRLVARISAGETVGEMALRGVFWVFLMKAWTTTTRSPRAVT